MKCVVCKVSYVKGQGRAGWVYTSDRTPFEKTQLIFKLFDLLKTEFAAGSVCTACYELLAQIDSLQFQVRQIVRALRTRIDCCSTEKDYLKTHTKEVSNESFLDDNHDEVELDDDDEEEKLEGDVENIAAGGEECSGSQSRRRKRRRGHARRGRSSSPIADAANASEHEVEMEKAEESVGINKKSGMPNLSTDNLDFAITVTTTTRGHEQLLYENYTYLRTTHQPQGVDLVRWKCSNYYATKTGCPAKLNTGLGGSCVLRDTRVGHNHSPPGESQLKIILFREQVRQIVSNHPDMKPAEILASARMLQDAAPPGSLLGLKEESIMRYIQRVKSKNRQQRQQQRRHEDLQIQQQQQQDEVPLSF